MDQQTQQQLLALNQRFYATVAEPFNATRLATSAGQSELIKRLSLRQMRARFTLPDNISITVADVGCGNGRFAWLLNERGVAIEYTGVDANETLLAFAQEHTAHLRHVRTHFVQADLAQPDWTALIARPAQGFHVVTCLATLHHLPGQELRQAVMQGLAELVMPGGVVAISTWQFLTSPRFTAKLVDWHEVGIDPAQVEPGDALLPWQQGGYAVRYLHQLDLEEIRALASLAGLQIEETYFADGKEGNLNLYALLRRPEMNSKDAP